MKSKFFGFMWIAWLFNLDSPSINTLRHILPYLTSLSDINGHVNYQTIAAWFGHKRLKAHLLLTVSSLDFAQDPNIMRYNMKIFLKFFYNPQQRYGQIVDTVLRRSH